MATTLSVKLDGQLARAFREYERRSKRTRSQAARRLLRSALGISEIDGDGQEVMMAEVATHNRAAGARAARPR